MTSTGTAKDTRVLIVHPAPAPYRVDLFNSLASRISLRILFLSKELSYAPHQPHSDIIAQLETDNRFLTTTSRFKYLNIRTGIKQEIKDFCPDVLVSHEFSHSSIVASMISTSQCPKLVVWTSQNAAQIANKTFHRRLITKHILKRAHAVLSYSPLSRTALTSTHAYPIDKIFLCANHQSRDKLRFLADKNSRQVFRECERLGISKKKLILTIGRLEPEKNHTTLLHAFAAAFIEHDDVALVVAGDGKRRADLAQLAEHLGIAGKTLFIGHTPSDKVPAWLSLSSIHILASTFEPYGAVVGEALAIGVPSIVSDQIGAAHLIAHNTQNGKQFSPHSAAALANLMMGFTPIFKAASDLIGHHRPPLYGPELGSDINGFLSACALAKNQH